MSTIVTHKSRKFTKQQKIFSILILMLSLLISAVIIASGYRQRGDDIFTPNTSVESCSDYPDLRCYATSLAQSTYSNEPAKAFADLKAVYEHDGFVKSECHQLTHIIGRTAVKKYGSISAAFTKGDSFCWSGYYHGVTEQAISDIGGDKIKQQANKICADLIKTEPYSFDHFNCVHGLGHGFMAVDSYELTDALKSCDLLDDQWERSSCYGGVFMENIMVAAREDGTTKYLKGSDLLYPCNAVDVTYKEQCYLMQTSYVLQKNGYNFSEAFRLCSTADADFQNTCYQSIGRDASGSTVSDITGTKANCEMAQDDTAKLNCVIGAAKDIVSYHHSDQQAMEFCKAIGGNLMNTCEEIVRSYYATFK